jgi:hypothetical protein
MSTFDFLNDPEKMRLLQQLEFDKQPNKKLVFVFSAPKVGSTSIVSSLRIFCSEQINVIHIHDEEMLYVLRKIRGITINEIILYYSHIGRDVYVIDVYRSPIERKISAYFEKIGSYHFNNYDDKVNTYNVDKVIIRFNNIFPHIAQGDHFIDKYELQNLPDQFDFSNKFLLIQQNGVKYIKLRLKDSYLWGNILTNIFNHKIGIVKDYASENKPIKDIYSRFKDNYRIPINLLDDIMKCKYLNYYYSSDELTEYYDYWKQRSRSLFTAFSLEQYDLYNSLTIENCHIDFIQQNHYMDEGCICKACTIKRNEIINKVLSGLVLNETDKIYHDEAKQQLFNKRITNAVKINKIIKNNIQNSDKGRRKDFRGDMNRVVNGLR